MNTTRRTDREPPAQSRPAHTNTSSPSHAPSARPGDRPSRYKNRSTTTPPEPRSPLPDPSASWNLRSTSKAANATLYSPGNLTFHTSNADLVPPDGMLSTPLVDYKHAANQTNKARAAAEAAKATAKAQRASSSTSGGSGERKNGSRSAPSAPSSKGEQHGRSSSISSTTGSSAPTSGTRDAGSESSLLKPFTERYGRRYLRDPTIPYPLPCDLPEIHRQTLRTLLMCQVFNGPICSPAFDKKPPKRVLEVACGSGFWSVMCHRYFSRRGFTSISFTGIDIAPVAPQMDSDDDMNWRFVQHDLRRLPLPFRDDEFNLIMSKDMSLVTPATGSQQRAIDEYLRILKPGGTLEIWDGDHCLRMLLPHTTSATSGGDDGSEDDERAHTNAMGVYTLTAQTPLAAAQNQYIQDYNTWMSKAMEARRLMTIPCTQILPLLHQESEILTDVGSRRLAIPLGEVRWEREGVGGAITQGANGAGQAVSSKGKGKSKEVDRRVLTAGQAALRRTALETFIQMIEGLEPVLREASGKDPNEWDRWQESMMSDLLNNDGTSWGECMEVCAGWARKRKPSAAPTAN